MLTIAKRIWQYLLAHEITITAEWIPSHLNIIADWESRNVSDSAEWKPSPSVFQSICQVMGQPDIDLFASRISHQVPEYFSWKADPDCLAVDAFRQQWEGAVIGVPSILPDYQSFETSGTSISRENDFDHSTLANPAMVPSTHVYVHSSTTVTASVSRSPVKPFGFNTPTTGFASLRD